MTPTDTTEKGLELLIFDTMTGPARAVGPLTSGTAGGETPTPYGGTGWIAGDPRDYDRGYCVDLVQLQAFLSDTQPDVAETVDLVHDSPTRRRFLSRLQGEISRRGTIDVLRRGIKDGPHSIDLFYGTPSPGNAAARERFLLNRFSLTRQLRYSPDETQRALDLCLFINGLPVASFELKNSLTKQTVADAVEQYKKDRDPRERLFEFGRCVVHFAVDDQEVRFCTHLKGKASWFLPFDKGWNDGAGNPPNPEGLKTDYLWKHILTRDGLTDILENYAQVVETKDPKTGKRKQAQIWPRYHQLDVVRKLLAHAGEHGAGQRYLIQHSAGSGKSNSIAWLAHQLIGLRQGGAEVFDSIIVVTDRLILDQQIKGTVKQFAQVAATVDHAEASGDLRRLIEQGKKIIISTVQKFPFILDDIGTEHRGRRFAIIIDEAHSSQGGRTSAAMSKALSAAGAMKMDVDAEDEDETFEDRINRIIEQHRLLPNASYFAFTATPKNKTLELFGEPYPAQGPEGPVTKHRPFHSYTMKQAIEESFILDVLQYYTPVESYYRLVKRIEGDPQFDAKRARKKLRHYVESHERAISLKAEIMVDHFHDQVIAQGKIGGQARAMVVTAGVDIAISYYHAITDYLSRRKSPYRAIVAFSGEHDWGGVKVTESSLNGFPSNSIADKIQEDPYRILVCADKFQTGYDEPLLHTMYVDKVLSGIKAVQTLSRLNRADPRKRDVFVLDFMNSTDAIEAAFADYYRTTILAEETDPNKLHDLKRALDDRGVYSADEVDRFVELWLGGAEREKLDPILDACVAVYLGTLDEDGQVEFKGNAKAFLRTYGFLSAILPYGNVEWEKLSSFLGFLVPKLPAPREEDLSRGILEAIDMDSYRVEKKATLAIRLPDEEAEIEPVPTEGGGHHLDPQMELLSLLIEEFNGLYGNIHWDDKDRVLSLITRDIPRRVDADVAYQNAKRNSDRQNARIEHDKALMRVMVGVLKDDTDLFKMFMDNESFQRWFADKVFRMTYEGEGARPTGYP